MWGAGPAHKAFLPITMYSACVPHRTWLCLAVPCNAHAGGHENCKKITGHAPIAFAQSIWTLDACRKMGPIVFYHPPTSCTHWFFCHCPQTAFTLIFINHCFPICVCSHLDLDSYFHVVQPNTTKQRCSPPYCQEIIIMNSSVLCFISDDQQRQINNNLKWL